MARLTEAQIAIAEARGRELADTQPRAKAASYDRASGMVHVELMNGCTYGFPAQLMQELNGADDEALAQIVIDGAGFNLHWPALDADLYVPYVASGLFGTKGWMSALAHKGGLSRSPAKAAAARANGAKGGRPKKSA